jgi:signal transduction histidine kinase
VGNESLEKAAVFPFNSGAGAHLMIPADASTQLAAMPALRVLFVEDAPTDYNLLARLLRTAGYTVDATRVESESQLRSALASGHWDAVISDHNLPAFSSTAALQVLKETGLDIPFIIVSGAIGEDIAVEAMIAGADDYILKSRLPRLVPALKRSLAAAAARREERLAQEKLRLLSAHLDRLKESERKAVAREIHDDIGGLLTGLAFDLSWLRQHTSGGGDAAARARLDNMQALLDQARASVERLLRQLRPPLLELGIAAALEWQARDFEKRYGIACRFHANRDSIALDEGQAGAMFRVCQESLTNIAKHAQARSVNIELFADAANVTLEVTDDGVGLPANGQSKPGAFGLLGMRERAANLGGWLEINSAPGRGTSVMLSLPLDPGKSAGSPS